MQETQDLQRATPESNSDALKEKLSLNEIPKSLKDFITEEEEKEEKKIPVPNHSFIDPLRYNPGKSIEVVREVRRNDPCPCGSGKKAKHCCVAGKEYRQIAPAKKRFN